MFMDGVDEFLKTLLDRVNEVVTNDNREKNVSLFNCE